jgi:CheY-like chemotaxis protein
VTRTEEQRILQIITWTLAIWVLLGWQGPSAAQNEAPAETLLLDAGRRSPTVAAILELPMEQPAERLSAVMDLLRLGEKRVAAKLLEPLTTAELSEDERAALVIHFGSATFLRLAQLDRPLTDGPEKNTAPTSTTESSEENLFAGARQFAEACMKAAGEKALDPQRIAQLVEQLADASPERRSAALADLQTTGSAGVRACMVALASRDRDQRSEQKSERAQLLVALASLRPAVEEPLLAALAAQVERPAQNTRFGRDLAELAGHMRLSRALPWLAHLAVCGSDDQAAAATRALASMGISKPSAAAVRTLATAAIDQLEKGSRNNPSASLGRSNLLNHADTPGQGIWWTWVPSSAAEETPANGSTGEALTSASYRTDELRVLAAARLAQIITSCGEPTTEQQKLSLIYAWQADAITNRNASKSTTQRAAALTTKQLSATLAEAVRRNHLDAASHCAQLLGERGDRSALVADGRRPAPLARALQHANADLRHSALSAIFKLGPERSFAGSSLLVESLWNFAMSSGLPQAVAVAPIASQSSNWAAQLRALGYDATATYTGQDALVAALKSPRLALILLDTRTDHPSAREVIYQLRSIPHAGHTPVAVLCSGSRLREFELLARHDPYLLAAVRPSSETRLADIVKQLQKTADPPLAAEEIRSQRASQALTWIAELLQSDSLSGELRRQGNLAEHTLFQPELADESLRVLASLGTAESQMALLEYSSSMPVPIDNRQEAAKAFAASVDRFGILLTTRQIVSQYDRYNASRNSDSQTQQLLGNLLDVLESQRSTSVTQ